LAIAAALRDRLQLAEVNEMAEQLAASGKVTLRGILFDTGKTDIKPESEPVLEQVAAMLKRT
jgi:outer membrane protein OmpA-like peptidoglycan-associated protein